MMLEQIDHNKTRELRLARPPVNAINSELIERLTKALEKAYKESDSVVISGREGMFSAGLDVPELLTFNRKEISRFWQAFFNLLKTLARSPVPVVSAITGHSPAGGAVVSLFTDYRIMANGDYKIGLNETQVGLVVPGVIQFAFRRLVGAHQAERLMVAGSLINPEQAAAVGMVDELGESPQHTVQRALEWCEQHQKLPQQAMLETRSMSRKDLTSYFDDFNALGVEAFVTHWFRDETQNTLKALVERLKK